MWNDLITWQLYPEMNVHICIIHLSWGHHYLSGWSEHASCSREGRTKNGSHTFVLMNFLYIYLYYKVTFKFCTLIHSKALYCPLPNAKVTVVFHKTSMQRISCQHLTFSYDGLFLSKQQQSTNHY